MPVLDCPHCHVRVLPKTDGRCPACHNDVNDLRGVDRDMATVEVSALKNLPRFCICCGEPTERTRVVSGHGFSWEQADDIDAVAVAITVTLAATISVLLMPFSLFRRESHEERRVRKLSAKLPCCENCADEAIEILKVLPAKSSIKLVAHQAFAEKYRALILESRPQCPDCGEQYAAASTMCEMCGHQVVPYLPRPKLDAGSSPMTVVLWTVAVLVAVVGGFTLLAWLTR